MLPFSSGIARLNMAAPLVNDVIVITSEPVWKKSYSSSASFVDSEITLIHYPESLILTTLVSLVMSKGILLSKILTQSTSCIPRSQLIVFEQEQQRAETTIPPQQHGRLLHCKSHNCDLNIRRVLYRTRIKVLHSEQFRYVQ